MGRVENRTSQPARSALPRRGAVADFLPGGKAEVVLVRGPLLVETGLSDDHARSCLQCWAYLTGTERPALGPVDSSSSSEGRCFSHNDPADTGPFERAFASLPSHARVAHPCPHAPT